MAQRSYTASSSALKRAFGSIWDSEKVKKKILSLNERGKIWKDACQPLCGSIRIIGQQIKCRPCNSDQQKMTQFIYPVCHGVEVVVVEKHSRWAICFNKVIERKLALAALCLVNKSERIAGTANGRSSQQGRVKCYVWTIYSDPPSPVPPRQKNEPTWSKGGVRLWEKSKHKSKSKNQ